MVTAIVKPANPVIAIAGVEVVTVTSQTVTLKWYHHPDRPCLGDERYADLALTAKPGRHGPGVYATREAMKQACYSCPVYFDCLTDVLSRPDSEHYGIQAGIQGKP